MKLIPYKKQFSKIDMKIALIYRFVLWKWSQRYSTISINFGSSSIPLFTLKRYAIFQAFTYYKRKLYFHCWLDETVQNSTLFLLLVIEQVSKVYAEVYVEHFV